LSPLEIMIVNPGAVYETSGNMKQLWKWENNRTWHQFSNNSAEWEECLVGTFENAALTSFKKHESFKDKLEESIPDDIKDYGLYIDWDFPHSHQVRFYLQNDDDANTIKRLHDRGLCFDYVSQDFVERQIKFWTTVLKAKEIIENYK
jgi:hypothetical protein